ncbi:MAG TPA: hypothetical protein G4O14_02840 [Anaerolineae bacterium]|nr:hypothetical protein [Anaerolineae bacterium]
MKDYIHLDPPPENPKNDPLLSAYISIVLQSINTGVDIFPSTLGVLDRPIFFERYFRRWVREAYDELSSYQDIVTQKAKEVQQVTQA